MVRKAKAEKKDKGFIDAEVKKLLDLKRVLAIEQGQNPDEQKQSKGKGKGGTKK